MLDVGPRAEQGADTKDGGSRYFALACLRSVGDIRDLGFQLGRGQHVESICRRSARKSRKSRPASLRPSAIFTFSGLTWRC